MIRDIEQQLSNGWVSGYQNLRIADTSENDDTEIEIYALDFHSRDNETVQMFMTRFSQMLSRLQSRVKLVGCCLEFDEPYFAIVEFREK